METIALAALGYSLAKLQYSDPVIFKVGVAIIIILGIFEEFLKVVIRVTTKLLSGKK